MSNIEAPAPYELQEAPPQEEREKESFYSFNLSAERARALEARHRLPDEQKLARDGFKNNASYWAKEYIAGIKTTHYFWEIVNENGEARLFHPQFGYADDIHKNALDETVPDFEMARRIMEYKVARLLPQFALAGSLHQPIIWSSPPPEDADDGIYGGYTMTHILETQEVDGRLHLIGRDVKNYLDTNSQKLLLEEHSGRRLFTKDPTSLEILSSPVRATYGTTSLDIERSIREKEEHLGLDKSEGSEKIFNKVFAQYAEELDVIYDLLGQEALSEEQVVGMFDAWGKRVDRAYQMEVLLGERLRNNQELTNEEILEYGTFLDSKYQERVGGGSCGDGVGFGSAEESVFGYTPDGLAGNFGRQEQKADFREDKNLCRCKGQDPHFHCPGEKEGKKCSHAIVVGKGIVKCPNCGKGKVC